MEKRRIPGVNSCTPLPRRMTTTGARDPEVIPLLLVLDQRRDQLWGRGALVLRCRAPDPLHRRTPGCSLRRRCLAPQRIRVLGSYRPHWICRLQEICLLDPLRSVRRSSPPCQLLRLHHLHLLRLHRIGVARVFSTGSPSRKFVPMALFGGGFTAQLSQRSPKM